MSLSLALNNALSGLNVNQRALSTVSHNIANANTEGYSRQSVEQDAVYLGEVGAGVRIADISRKVDQYLMRSLQTQSSSVGRTEVITTYHDRMQVLLGEPGSNNTIDEYIESFFNSVQALAETPERISHRETAVDTGITLARELSTLAEGLEDLRFQADQDIREAVRTVNIELKNLDNLNVAINNATALGNPTAGLEDQMDLALERIADYMDINTYRQKNGSVHIYTANGVALLDDGLYQLQYNEAAGVQTFIENDAMSALEVVRINEDGQISDDPTELISGGVEEEITTIFQDGRLLGLKQLRDEIIPDVLAQLDNLSGQIRDQFNALHNDGSGFPGTNILTGTRLVRPSDASDWSGNVMIGVLDENGEPLPSPYPDEAQTGIRPLNMDLGFLDSGNGAGQPDVQTIVNEINNHFFPPPVKANLGNLNNIQLVSTSEGIPGSPPQFNFDFDLDNISGDPAEFFVTDVQVVTDTAVPIPAANITSDRPALTIDPVNGLQTTTGSDIITVNTLAPHGLSNGDTVFIPDPGAPLPGSTIPNTDLGGYFTVNNVTANGFEIQVATTEANPGVSVGFPNMTAYPDWDTLQPGEKSRIRDTGTVSVDLSGNTGAAYYDVTVTVGVNDQTVPLNVETGTITFRIPNNENNLLNDRYNNIAVTGAAQRITGTTSQPSVIARLVDENGNELPRVNGVYADTEGYLSIESLDPNHTISISEESSRELGITSTTPTREGSDRGFSHYFELNNFFESNEPNETGDQIDGSAINMRVEERLENNANLITLGKLTRSNQPVDPSVDPLYTYERFIGDNSTIQALAKLGIEAIEFDAAGGLDNVTQSFNGYSGEMLGYLAANAVSSESEARDSQILYEGFNERLDSIRGVNIDEELADTIVYQHAYTASARVITVTDELFQTLLGAVR
jgi:flagellar hook-associated protein FlgK